MHPKVDVSQVPTHVGSGYPKRFHHVNGNIPARSYQDVALGLTDFGANRCTLPPGSASSLRHYHTHDDELVVVLSGAVVMLTDEGETPMGPGDIASFPKGVTNAHCFANRSTEPAVILAIGKNDPDDECFYPDVDMRAKSPNQGGGYVSRTTGEPYTDAT